MYQLSFTSLNTPCSTLIALKHPVLNLNRYNHLCFDIGYHTHGFCLAGNKWLSRGLTPCSPSELPISSLLRESDSFNHTASIMYVAHMLRKIVKKRGYHAVPVRHYTVLAYYDSRYSIRILNFCWGTRSPHHSILHNEQHRKPTIVFSI